MRRSIPSWAGAAALGWLGFMILSSFLQKLSGVDVSTQPAQDFLNSIADRRTLFTASVFTGTLSITCALVTIAGLIYVLKDDYPEQALVAGLVFISGAVVTLVSFAMYGNLVGTAMEFVHGGLAPAGVIAQAGDIQGDQFEIIYFLGQVVMWVGAGALGVSLVRGGFARVWLGVAAMLVAILSPLLYHLPAEFMIARAAFLVLLTQQALLGPEQAQLREGETQGQPVTAA